MLRLVAASLLLGAASASFCGDSSIPYSFEVLPDGQPVLGCARPSCFGWSPSGKPISESGTFYRINNQPDGFFRQDRNQIPAFGNSDPRYSVPQTAVCEAGFASGSCGGVNQWVGGIAPLVNVSAFPTVLQCCSYDLLVNSEDRGVATVTGGQIVVGGEVISNGQQIAFDYIADVSKTVRADRTVSYEISIRRFSCPGLPGPADGAKLDKPLSAQAFQAPNVPVDQPLPLPDGTQPQQAILEEVIREDAEQLQPGVQLQPQPPQGQFVQQQFVQPPPQQQFFIPPQQPQGFVPVAPAAAAAQPYYYGGAGVGACFTGDMLVELADGSEKRMDALEKADWVKTVSSKGVEFEPVSFWLHREPSAEFEFHRFTTDNGKEIKLTAQHYIYKGDCKHAGQKVDAAFITNEAVFAEEVKEGDCLYTVEDKEVTEVRVVKAELVTEVGIYAPMTANGRIVVNGIHASCHNIIQSHSVQNTFFSYVNWMNELFGSDNSITELPSALPTLMDIYDLVVPKNFASL